MIAKFGIVSLFSTLPMTFARTSRHWTNDFLVSTFYKLIKNIIALMQYFYNKKKKCYNYLHIRLTREYVTLVRFICWVIRITMSYMLSITLLSFPFFTISGMMTAIEDRILSLVTSLPLSLIRTKNLFGCLVNSVPMNSNSLFTTIPVWTWLNIPIAPEIS